VIASDGVFEFLTNQKTAEIISKKKDPLKSCIAIAYESYEMWFDHEDRTDDITVIIIEVPEQQGVSDLGDITLEERQVADVVGSDSRPHFDQKRPRKSIIISN
jgi:serine/threonine protein phosphatase PrpC